MEKKGGKHKQNTSKSNSAASCQLMSCLEKKRENSTTAGEAELWFIEVELSKEMSVSCSSDGLADTWVPEVTQEGVARSASVYTCTLH